MTSLNKTPIAKKPRTQINTISSARVIVSHLAHAHPEYKADVAGKMKATVENFKANGSW